MFDLNRFLQIFYTLYKEGLKDKNQIITLLIHLS